MSARYVVNQPVVLTVSFTVAGTATDPTAVSLVVTDPAGTASTYTYALAQITKTSTGIYTKTVTADSVGVWSYVWTGTGTAADVQDGTFTVYDDVPLNYLYATLDELKAEKGISDVADDSTLQISLGAASRQIDGACGWRFWKDSVLTARYFTPDNPKCLYLLDETPADGIATATGLTVELDNDDSGTYETNLTVNTDFVLVPRNAQAAVPLRPYTEIELTGVNYWFPRSSYNRATVKITAKWGWPAIPDDIKKACLIQAQQLAKSKDAAFGVAALAAIDGAGMRAQAWNPLALELIRPYRRPGLG